MTSVSDLSSLSADLPLETALAILKAREQNRNSTSEALRRLDEIGQGLQPFLSWPSALLSRGSGGLARPNTSPVLRSEGAVSPVSKSTNFSRPNTSEGRSKTVGQSGAFSRQTSHMSRQTSRHESDDDTLELDEGPILAPPIPTGEAIPARLISMLKSKSVASKERPASSSSARRRPNASRPNTPGMPNVSRPNTPGAFSRPSSSASVWGERRPGSSSSRRSRSPPSRVTSRFTIGVGTMLEHLKSSSSTRVVKFGTASSEKDDDDDASLASADEFQVGGGGVNESPEEAFAGLHNPNGNDQRPSSPSGKRRDSSKASSASPTSARRRSSTSDFVRMQDIQPQDVPREAAAVFWDMELPPEQQVEVEFEEADLEEQKEALDPHALSRLLRIPLHDVEEAIIVFKKYATLVEQEDDEPDLRIEMDNFGTVLSTLCRVASVADLPEDFVDQAFTSADRDGGGDIDIEEFILWYNSFSFSEEVTLTPEAREVRALARELDCEIVDIDRYKKCFDKYDTEKVGIIEYSQFKLLVTDLLKVPAGQELPNDRVMSMWRNADEDGSGELAFAEFCAFYRKMFDNGGEGTDAVMDFYRNVRRVSVRMM